MQLQVLLTQIKTTTRGASVERLFHTGLLWDLMGYLLVVALASYLVGSHLGLFLDATDSANTPYRVNPSPEVYATVDRHPAGYQLFEKSAADRDLIRTSYSPVERMAPGLLLERLEMLNSRPGWTLLDIDAEQAKRDLVSLIREGDAALPAIERFLAQGGDVDLTKGGVDKAVGYPSLRLALFAALDRIGGHQVESILYKELSRTVTPIEIEALGNYLNDDSPGLYDQDIVRAARDVFSQVIDGGGEGKDMGPLFRVFSRYGDASLVQDLEQVNQLNWGRYAAITLANIPGGQGLQGLSNWVYGAEKSDASAQFAIKLLAQSSDYPTAANALLDSVRANLISDRRWPELSQLIIGTYHMQLDPPGEELISAYSSDIRSRVLRANQYISRTPGGGQVVYGLESVSSTLAPEQVLPRLELVDQLLFEVSSPVAKRELQKAYEALWLLHLQQEY